jgi:hypothetical protein
MLAAAKGLSVECVRNSISEAAEAIAEVLRLLVDNRPDLIRQLVPHLAPLVDGDSPLPDFVDQLYDFWRDYERFLIYEGAADASRDRAVEGHLPFVRANEELRALVLDAYRRIDSNLRGYWPRAYHQVPAGASVGLLVDNIDWPCPDGPYRLLENIPFVRLALLQLPVVFNPKRNYRKGSFVPVQTNPLDGLKINQDEWFCMPVKVGPLLIDIFFHEDYLPLASSLVNLFEIAGHVMCEKRRMESCCLEFRQSIWVSSRLFSMKMMSATSWLVRSVAPKKSITLATLRR